MLRQERGHANFLSESKRSIWVQNFVSGCCMKFRNDLKYFKQFWIVTRSF